MCIRVSTRACVRACDACVDAYRARNNHFDARCISAYRLLCAMRACVRACVRATRAWTRIVRKIIISMRDAYPRIDFYARCVIMRVSMRDAYRCAYRARGNARFANHTYRWRDAYPHIRCAYPMFNYSYFCSAGGPFSVKQ